MLHNIDIWGNKMENIRYEHHNTETYLSDICPFKIKFLKNSKDVTSNWHKNPEMIYVSEGSGTLIYSGESYPMKKGDMFIINQEAVHHVFSKHGIDYYFIIVDEDFCLQNGIALGNYTFNIKAEDKYTKNKFLNVIRETELYTEEYRDISPARLRGAVLSLLIDVCEKHSSKKVEDREKTSDRYIKSALWYINENFANNITLENVAAHLGINKFYLTREFKKYTGETVFSCINMLRCKKAEHILLEGGTVTDAAMESGFESVSYFSRMYKKTRGISPSEYRKVNKSDIKKNKKLYVEENWITS